MTNLTEKTSIKKDHSGWSGETIIKRNGKNYLILTIKGNNGKIKSYYRVVNIGANGSISFMMFGGEQGDLIEVLGRATEKTIKETHNKALIVFDEKIKECEEEREETPVIGSIIFLDDCFGKTKGDKGNEHIVYHINENGHFGLEYYTVERSTLHLNVYDNVRDYKNKFGIGMYFLPDYKFSGTQEDLENLVIKAQELKKKEEEAAESEKLLQLTVKKGKIEEGKKLLSIPSWAKTVIVADDYEDQSDSQTDYFHASKKNTFYLAFSKTSRNNMKELEKACKNWDETKKLLQDEDTQKYTFGHSVLPDYFIGSSSWSGLKVNKRKYFDLTSVANLEALYIAAAEGRCFFTQPKKVSKEIQTSAIDLQIIDYSEKSIVVIGDTKPYKDRFKAIGGRFNFRLSCGAGWVFSKTNTIEVENLLNQIKSIR